jgi:ketosteroid isomerase-like protein
MADPTMRSLVEAFYAAYATREPRQVAPFLHDAVAWTVSGPIELLPFCGTHRGKAAVLDLIGRQVPDVFRVYSFAPESMLVDGDRAAMLSRQRARTNDGRVLSFRVANFLRFHDGKLIENMPLLDSFDAVEQVLGHPLARGLDAGPGNLIAI